MSLLVKNCSRPSDNVCDADCKTPRFDLGGQEGASIFAPAGWRGGWGRGNGAICERRLYEAQGLRHLWFVGGN